MKTKMHVGRPQAMKMIKEMRDHAVQSDDLTMLCIKMR